MGCSEAFRGNENGVTYPRNITSHIGTPRNVSEEIWPSPRRSENDPKTTKIEGYINHAFVLFRGTSSEHFEMPPRDMGGKWKGVMWLVMNMWMPLGSFRGNFGFHEKWTNGVFKGFQGNANGAEHPRKVTSHVGTPMNVSGENMTRPGKAQKSPKNNRNWML